MYRNTSIFKVLLNNKIQWLFEIDENIYSIDNQDSDFIKSILREDVSYIENIQKTLVKAEELEFYCPPIIFGGRIFCVGLNYINHLNETKREETKHPVIFTRTMESFVGSGCAIRIPKESNFLDFEGELAIVIGKSGRRIPQSQALDHIAGYTLANDSTVRDWQFHTHQYTPGKNFDCSGSLGPNIWPIENRKEFEDLEISTTVNGEQMQRASISDMLFSIESIISYCSSFTKLRTGDVILTGTPGGIGFKRNPEFYLKDGDKVEIKLSNGKSLSNIVIKENLERQNDIP